MVRRSAVLARRGLEASPPPLSIRRRVRVLARAHLTHPQSHASQSHTLHQLLVPESSAQVYPTLDAFLEDVVRILREEVAELVRLGATYIQLDAPHYTQLLDERTRPFYEERGGSLDRWLARGVELENAVMAGFPDVTFGFHL